MPPALLLWRIVATARPDDTRWEDHPYYAEVIVRAESAALARLTAARALYHGNAQTQFGEERDPVFISALRDEKLYRVERLESHPRFAAAGPREVLLATERAAAA